MMSRRWRFGKGGRWAALVPALLLFSAVSLTTLCGCASASSWFPVGNGALRPALQPRLRLDRRMVLDEDPASTIQMDSAQHAQKVSRSRYAVPALFSAVIPGTGEIATGHIWNGIPLLVAEVAIWVSYANYNDQGNQLRREFEAFVDAHWDYDLWQENLEFIDAQPETPPPSWWNPEEFPGACDCSPPYISKEEDPLEYYENAGKYRHFWPGWDDWIYKDSDSVANRATYISMRNRSNDNFDNAGTMLGLAVLTRAISVTQTLWLVHRDVRQQSLQLRPTYSRRKGAGMELTWSY